MTLHPEIIAFPGKRLAGKSIRHALVNDKTQELWQRFMTEQKKLQKLSDRYYAVQIYDERPDFKGIDPHMEFTIWAACEVPLDIELPDGMDHLDLAAGTYAVFIHRGPVSRFFDTLKSIFFEWLPQSGFQLDHRPHFTVMGEKYDPMREDSEEEVWVPVT